MTVLDGQTFYMTVNGWYLKPGTDEKMRTAEPGSGGITWTFKAAGTGDEEYRIHQNGSYLVSNGSRWTIVKDDRNSIIHKRPIVTADLVHLFMRMKKR